MHNESHQLNELTQPNRLSAPGASRTSAVNKSTDHLSVGNRMSQNPFSLSGGNLDTDALDDRTSSAWHLNFATNVDSSKYPIQPMSSMNRSFKSSRPSLIRRKGNILDPDDIERDSSEETSRLASDQNPNVPGKLNRSGTESSGQKLEDDCTTFPEPSSSTGNSKTLTPGTSLQEGQSHQSQKHGKSKHKDGEQQISPGTAYSTASTKKQATNRSVNHKQLKHQVSSPSNSRSRSPYKLNSPQYPSSDTSFLSMLAASRPTAAKGLLGVASAALAAARAGTFVNVPTSPGVPNRSELLRSSQSVERRTGYLSDEYHGHRVGECSHGTILMPSSSAMLSLRVPSGHIHLNYIMQRRHSDTALNYKSEKSDHPHIQLLICMDHHASHINRLEQTCAECLPILYDRFGYPTGYTGNSGSNMAYRKTSLNQLRSFPTDDYETSALHSSLVELNTLEPHMIQDGDSNKSNSAVVLNPCFTTHPDPLISGISSPPCCTSEHLHRQSVILPLNKDCPCHPIYVDESKRMSRGNRHQTVRPSVSTLAHRTKRTGLDSIGLDFMRANGARPGLLQLRHVKEFKAAKELELQKEEQKQSKKHATKVPTALGLFPNPQLTNQQNPFHQLISGGVLGATVLAMAAKDKSSNKDGRETKSQRSQDGSQNKSVTPVKEKEKGVPDETSTPTVTNEITNTSDRKHNLDAIRIINSHSTDETTPAIVSDDQVINSSDELAAIKNVRRSKLSIDRMNIPTNASSVFPNFISPTGGAQDKLRHKLARSITVTTSTACTKPDLGYSSGRDEQSRGHIKLHGAISAPGLAWTSHDDRDRSEEFFSIDTDSSCPWNGLMYRQYHHVVPSHNSSSISIHTHNSSLFPPESSTKQTDVPGQESNALKFNRDNSYNNSKVAFAMAQSVPKQLSLDRSTHLSPKWDEINKMLSSDTKTRISGNRGQRYSTPPNTPNFPTGQNSLGACGYQSRVRRLRDNFQKGRSSTYTWRPTCTIGELLENQLDEEQPLLVSRFSESDSKVSKLAPLLVKSVEGETVTEIDRTSPNRKISTQEFNVSVKVPELIKTESKSDKTSEHDTSESDAKSPSSEKRLLSVDYGNEDDNVDSEKTVLQRRRDAMNNQYQQRTIRNVGYRLGQRKRLFEKRCRISDFSLSFALFGILVMLVETELTFAGVYAKDSIYSYLTKSLISTSTLILLGLILAYHVYVIKIFSCDDSIEDWRMAINCNRVMQMTMEVLVCLIHPFPGSFHIRWPIPPSFIGPSNYNGIRSMSVSLLQQQQQQQQLLQQSQHPNTHQPFATSNTSNSWNLSKQMQYTNSKLSSTLSSTPFFDTDSNIETEEVSIDLILSLPMFLRLYLLFRAMLLHSKMFTDAGSRSIGAMNKVNFDTRFIFKTLMTMCPGKLLLGFILCLWIIFSWTLRACESFHDVESGNLLNSMWLIAVTFLSIGYGDIVPHTYCGRVIALATGVMGSGCTALIVAVFARKLELSKAEKHVIHFMMENQLNKKVKNYAANVLRETWLIYKYTKLVKRVDASKVRSHQRKFLRAIHGLRRMKLDQRKVQDSANTLVDLAKTQTNIYDVVTDLRVEQSCLQHRLETLESSLLKIQDQLRALPALLRSTIIQPHFAYPKHIANTNPPNPIKTEDGK